jgi:hypothetical protein
VAWQYISHVDSVAPAIGALQRNNAVFATYWAGVVRQLCACAAPEAAQQPPPAAAASTSAQGNGTPIDVLEYFLLPVVYIAELPGWIGAVVDANPPWPSASPTARAERLRLQCARLALQRFQRSVRDSGFGCASNSARPHSKAHSARASLWARSVELPMRSFARDGSMARVGSTGSSGGASSAPQERFECGVAAVHPAVATFVRMDTAESRSTQTQLSLLSAATLAAAMPLPDAAAVPMQSPVLFATVFQRCVT